MFLENYINDYAILGCIPISDLKSRKQHDRKKLAVMRSHNCLHASMF